MEKVEEKGWKLVSRCGVAPIVENWVYTSKGRRYTLSYTYYFDIKNKVHQFGNIVVSTPKKTYYISKNKLNKFLAKRNIPPFFF